MVSDQFAKLYETEELGQVLVTLDSCDEFDGMEIRYYFMPKDMGVCSAAMQFKSKSGDLDFACDKAEAAFEKVDEEQALKFVNTLLEELGHDRI